MIFLFLFFSRRVVIDLMKIKLYTFSERMC
nr:MAG TPA: hypothetical protein [Caudoviricetes sp.]DAL49611.1 MAG TPA_asm: hypothetical protein [Caudoviricetes sp.]